MKKNESKNTELNIIGAQTIIKGEIISQGDLRIDGTVEGNISTKTKVVVGVNAKIVGNIEAGDVLISGKIHGNILCSNILSLNASASIEGDINTKKIVVENGAAFNGKCTMGNIATKAEDIKPNVQAGK